MIDNKGQSGESIRAYTLEEAKEWAEEHLEKNLFALEFGELPTDGGRVMITICVPAHVKVMLERLRSKNNKSISKIIEELILKHIGEL